MASCIDTQSVISESDMSTMTFQRPKLMKTAVHIKEGLVDRVPEFIPAESRRSNLFIIADSKVDEIYGNKIVSSLKADGLSVYKVLFPAGECNKTLEIFGNLVQQILDIGIDKKSVIISLGGGVCNNVAGFIAASLYRGIGLIHIATSMMSQVDAAIDFKQAVNHGHGKNLIGCFYPPICIIIDPFVLKTLPRRHVLNGLSESIKHALCQNTDFLEYFLSVDNWEKDQEFLSKVVETTVRLKIDLMEADQTIDDAEMSMQYGHCIGHALEKCSNFDLLHGEGISIGMVISARIAEKLGVCEDKDAIQKHIDIFEKYDLPTKIPENLTVEKILNTIRFDKHYLHGLPNMGLIKNFGQLHCDSEGSYAIPITYELLEEVLHESF